MLDLVILMRGTSENEEENRSSEIEWMERERKRKNQVIEQLFKQFKWKDNRQKLKHSQPIQLEYIASLSQTFIPHIVSSLNVNGITLFFSILFCECPLLST